VFLAAAAFGHTAFNENDTAIGQRVEDLAPYRDYPCPMVDPSGYHLVIPSFANPVDLRTRWPVRACGGSGCAPVKLSQGSGPGSRTSEITPSIGGCLGRRLAPRCRARRRRQVDGRESPTTPPRPCGGGRPHPDEALIDDGVRRGWPGFAFERPLGLRR
jgi:hypothetical protein